MARRLWPWFLCGFLATFVLLAVVLTVYVMLPTGQSVTMVKLWRYYFNEWPQAIGGSTLGPASSNQEGLMSTTAQHVSLSLLGGAALSAIGWWVQRRSVVPI